MILSAPERFSASCIAPERLERSALWFIYRGSQILAVRDESGTRIPSALHPRDLGLETLREQYLGDLAGEPCFAAEVDRCASTPAGMDWLGLRALFGTCDNTVFAIAGRAFQIMDWDRTHQFCGHCGTPTEIKAGERSRFCPSCNQIHYPRIAPAIMVMVRRDTEFLLARSAHFPPGMYSALAGFTEPGETLEQTVMREVREEVSIEVRNIRYFASQPWPFPHSLMIAFHADYASGEITPDLTEIEAADWFSPERLPEALPGKISIARRLLDATLDDLRNSARAR